MGNRLRLTRSIQPICGFFNSSSRPFRIKRIYGSRPEGRPVSKLPCRSLATTAASIRSKLRQSAVFDRRLVEDDISARLVEAQAGHEWAEARERVIAACARRGITEDEWCLTQLGCTIGT